MILQFIINGLITGILYALLAIGFSLVYHTTRIFHIAAAALYVLSAYFFYVCRSLWGLPLFLSLLFALILSMSVSAGMEQTVYYPLKKKKASLSAIMIASIGLMTIFTNVLALYFSPATRLIATHSSSVYLSSRILLTIPQLYQGIGGSIALVAFVLFSRFSKWGLRFRALSNDEELFQTLGYSIQRTRLLVFLLSGLFIGLSSCFTVYDIGIDPYIGMTVLINAMVAMIIGGAGRFTTCILGGLLLGVLQSLVVYRFSSSWQNAITFILLLLFLFLRPQGIAGYKRRTV